MVSTLIGGGGMLTSQQTKQWSDRKNSAERFVILSRLESLEIMRSRVWLLMCVENGTC